MDNQKDFYLYFPEAPTADLELYTDSIISNVLTVREYDHNPSVANVVTINVNNGTLTDDSNGEISLDNGGLIELQRTGVHSLFYPMSGAGLTSCLAACTTGDTVWLPGGTIAEASWTIPVGVSIVGKGLSTILQGTLETGDTSTTNISTLNVYCTGAVAVSAGDGITNIRDCNLYSSSNTALYVSASGTANVYFNTLEGELGYDGVSGYTVNLYSVKVINNVGSPVEPLASDRSAWDVTVAIAKLHASDIQAENYVYHLPPATTNGYIPVVVDGYWEESAPGTAGVPALIHHTQHENGESDEISVAGLSGVLADKQDADKLQGRDVDSTLPTDTQVLKWDDGTSKWKPADETPIIESDETPLAKRSILDFQGFHFDDDPVNDRTIVSIVSGTGMITPVDNGDIPYVVTSEWQSMSPAEIGYVFPPVTHASRHENAGADEISVVGLSGLLADPQTPVTHHTRHEDGGDDEISVTGLSGLLADKQTPLAHKATHQLGGSDVINVTGLIGLLATAQTPAYHTQNSSTITTSGLTGYLTGLTDLSSILTRIDSILTTAHTWTQAQTIATIIGNKFYPASDSTTAIQILKADATTIIANFDTTNRRTSFDTITNTHRINIANGHVNFENVTKPAQLTAALAGAGAGSVNNGDHYYWATYLTAFGETAVSTKSTVVTVTDNTTDGKVNVSVVASTNPSVTNIKLYRSSIAGGAYAAYLLDTIANTTTTYVDNKADSALGTVRSEGRDNTTAGSFYLNNIRMMYLIDNVLLGQNSAPNITTAAQIVAVGAYSLGNITTGSYNVAIGRQALYGITDGLLNVGVGTQAGLSNIHGSSNSYFGHGVAPNHTGSTSVIIGAGVGGAWLTSQSNILAIDVTNTATPLIYGDFSTAGRSVLINGTLGATRTDAITNTITEMFNVDHESSGTPATGFGARISTYLMSSTTARQAAGAFDFIWSTSTHASRTSRLIAKLENNGGASLSDIWYLDPFKSTLLYDTSNYFETNVSSAGLTTLKATGTSAGIDINNVTRIGDITGAKYFSVLSTGVAKTMGRQVAVAVKTTDYALTVNDEFVVFTASGTAFLPAATGSGQTYRIANEGTTGVVVTIDADGSETIKGSTTQALYPGEDLVITDYESGKWA